MGRTLVIAGGASGIGLATAKAACREDSTNRVFLIDIDKDKLHEARVLLGKNSCHTFVADVTSSTRVDEVARSIFSEVQFIDALIITAGNTHPSPSSGLGDESWQKVLDVHLNGAFYLSRAFYPLLRSHESAIVVTSSVAGTLGMPQRLSYNTVKHGLEGLTKSLAVEWAKHGIRVNAVAPGYVDTPFNEALKNQGLLNPNPIIARTPLKRWAHPAEIAEAILFLGSQKASYITGQTLVVDGGLTISGDWYTG